ncbi:hypothetical protein GCM10029992_27360 [Glycomyces albus]
MLSTTPATESASRSTCGWAPEMVPLAPSVRVAQTPTAAPRVPAMRETMADTATTRPSPGRATGAGRCGSGSIGERREPGGSR